LLPDVLPDALPDLDLAFEAHPELPAPLPSRSVSEQPTVIQQE